MIFSILLLFGFVLTVFLVFVTYAQIAHPRHPLVKQILLTFLWLVPACVCLFLTLAHAYDARDEIGFWKFLGYCGAMAAISLGVCISLNHIDGKNGPTNGFDDHRSRA